ncbi:MAG: hypothetical protein OEZ39_16335 [Gammaproteobacteria bacterium]|nr:hypothetical protein [Gammaproteobacteria bacterium]MDH5653428.1 hypothetical protein [Gammaproteobacteria bacterium]
MNLELEIKNVFPGVLSEPSIPDSFIEENENIMELEGEVDYFKFVPAYMLWCLKFKDKKLVDVNTVNALAEYGRTKIKENSHLNFMHLCNAEQKKVVAKFLEWCAKEIITADKTQIERAVKNWSS